MARKHVQVDTNHLDLVEAFFNKHKKVIGIDEVGRGSLAGPILIGAVGFKERFYHSLVTDSKLLSRKHRHIAKDIIMEKYDYLEFQDVPVELINDTEANLNVLIIEGIKKILDDAAKNGVTGALVDWLQVDHPSIEVLSLPKMELLSSETAAASIVAKIKRDKMMAGYDVMFPEYSFKKNQGYGTKEHLDALVKHGPSEIHRKFFCKKAILKHRQKEVDKNVR